MGRRKAIEPARGLFKNGALWWYRVKAPSGLTKRRSCGTDNTELANSIVAMLGVMRKLESHWDLLEAAARGRVELLPLYDAWMGGRLAELRVRLDDVDLEPFVAKWERHLIAQDELAAGTIRTYVTHVRTLISEGREFWRSGFTEQRITDWLNDLDGRYGRDLSTSTKRRYYDSLRAFVKYIRKRAPLEVNPVKEYDDTPKNNAPRDKYYEHEDVLRVLDFMPDGEAKVFITLAYGTGMEVSALFAATRNDVLEKERAVWAHGKKNKKGRSYRDRICFIDLWAWERVWPHVQTLTPRAPLFQNVSLDHIRDTFYAAQVAARLAGPPGLSTTTGKLSWDGPHTIHDCRHSFCVNRVLGQDGEPRKDLQYLADQLGHADTVMVSRIYAKFRLKARLDALIAAEAQHAAAEEASTVRIAR